MRIEKLEIKNYRQYRNVTFDFAKKDGKPDIHVVLGRNGTGKTNMLNAITWCLYEEESHLGDKNASISELNTEAISEARKNGQNTVSLSVAMTIATDDMARPKLRIRRIADFNVKPRSVQPTEVRIEVQEYLSDGKNWNAYTAQDLQQSTISRHIPHEINEYIFFDGEQLEKYFQGANREKLQNGINSLTQVNLINRAFTALEDYRKRDLTPKIKEVGDDVIDRIQDEIQQQEMLKAAELADLEEYKKQKASIGADIIKYDEIISTNEKLEEQKNTYAQLEAKYDALDGQLVKLNKELMLFVREQYTLFGMYSAFSSYYKYVKAEADKGNLPPHFDKSMLLKMMNSSKCGVCGQTLTTEAYDYIQRVIDKMSVSSEVAVQLQQSLPVMRANFDEMNKFPVKLKSYQDERRRLEQEIKVCDQELTNYQLILNSIPGKEAILDAIHKKKDAAELLSTTEQGIGACNERIKKIDEKLEQLNENLKTQMRKNEKMSGLLAQREYVDNCKAILTEIKNETVVETRNRIQEETFKIFQDLIWKKDTFSRIEIGEDYTFKLFDKYENQTLGSCSAAERALLALSFTLALQDVSGHSSLLYIDTPIGRVDTENRANFMNNLLDVARNKQVILTFTPTEFDHTVSNILTGNTSTFGELLSEEGVTTLKVS